MPSQACGSLSSTVCEAETIHFYEWDSRSDTWCGPNEPGSSTLPDERLLKALEATPAHSWYGPVKCVCSGETATRFFAVVHDLSDCATATLYCDDSKAGPAAIIVVIPAARRHSLREDFAFEFLSFARFLGALSAGAELQVHEAIAAALQEETQSGTVVISISTGLWQGELDPILSLCVEKLGLTLYRWLKGSAAPVG